MTTYSNYTTTYSNNTPNWYKAERYDYCESPKFEKLHSFAKVLKQLFSTVLF